jgi:DNA-binding MarR family transcriptional regulator
MSEPRTNWWAPIWPGLIVDREGKHVRRLGMAIWLLLYLIVHARRATGIVTQRQRTIAAKMRMPRRTIQRWLSRLEQREYIEILVKSQVLTIRIKRWKSLYPRQK